MRFLGFKLSIRHTISTQAKREHNERVARGEIDPDTSDSVADAHSRPITSHTDEDSGDQQGCDQPDQSKRVNVSTSKDIFDAGTAESLVFPEDRASPEHMADSCQDVDDEVVEIKAPVRKQTSQGQTNKTYLKLISSLHIKIQWLSSHDDQMNVLFFLPFRHCCTVVAEHCWWPQADACDDRGSRTRYVCSMRG